MPRLHSHSFGKITLQDEKSCENPFAATSFLKKTKKTTKKPPHQPDPVACAKVRNPLLLCISNPLLPCSPPQFECRWQQKRERMMDSSWKLVIISSALMCPCCDSWASFIQPPTPICTCHLLLCPPSMLTSEEAGCPPTSPAECDQLDRQPGPSMQPLCRCCDRQQTQRALILPV